MIHVFIISGLILLGIITRSYCEYEEVRTLLSISGDKQIEAPTSKRAVGGEFTSCV